MRIIITITKRYLAIALILLLDSTAASADSTPVFPDLNNIARLRFHTGKAGHDGPEISPYLPDIPGPPSPWFLTQWGKTELLDPLNMKRSDNTASDPMLGAPLYSFSVDVSRLDIYARQPTGYVFGLSSKDGALTDTGGTNVFVSANALPGATFDRKITYDLDVTMPVAVLTQNNSAALSSGAIAVQFFSGFTLLFTDPQTKKMKSFFMQIQHSDARNQAMHYRSCYSDNGNLDMLATTTLPGEVMLPYTPFAQPVRHLSYSLSDHLCDLVSRPYDCPGPNGRQIVELPDSARDFRNWRLTSMYVGLETQNADHRSSSKMKEPQGSDSATIRIFNLKVLRHNDITENQENCPRN